MSKSSQLYYDHFREFGKTNWKELLYLRGLEEQQYYAEHPREDNNNH